ncbi:helix-turn-helix domain-containing protein [Variovorax soli]|uniref:AraC-like DNA-binding protein/peptidoglycan/LPS O-acetylase OafA/YrhL n=1 Tax=Variovorax soli TaxID=376815 RepID=A0ABU1N7L9_9BURK|nr:helix-turn-helix domain-containing protein [Variovorax soli]MDR6534447.1 AraC-like DNA-binding protein/peptidoglycan/LPS O-acetylase OafA/YrhL [Variovorax soli]
MTDALPLTLFDAALRGMVLALLLLLAWVLGRDRPRLPAARAALAMTLGLAVQVISSTPLFEAQVPRLWQAPLVAVSVANGVLFWIFVQALFDDDFALRPLHAAAWLAVAALAGFNCAVMNGSASVLAPLTIGLQRGVPLLFAMLATIAAAAHWRADLVEGRRRLRAFIVVTGVVYTLAMLAARLASPQGRLSGATATVDAALLLLIVAVTAFWMLRLAGSEIFPSERVVAASPVPRGESAEAARPAAADGAEPPAPDPADQALAEALQRLMDEERAYRAEDLSIAGLAARLGTPEYRLRRLINQRLGHRNFNAFVNGFRLAEARAALADPMRRSRPVLAIALEAGFQSIGPFNRAFKAATGLTPTEYRREKLADS